MNNENKKIYEFGSFKLDSAEHTLSQDDEIVSLTPKVFDTLLILIENSGHLVEKDEILEKVWKDTIVEEANLAKNISILRKVLSNDGLGDSFIETVPKRGYRFTAEVKEISVEENSKPLETQTSQPNLIQKNSKTKIAIIATVLIISVLAFGFYFYSDASKANALTDKDVILLADFENKTGEDIFDGTLKKGLWRQLWQSPFLSIFPEEQARKTLEFMKRSKEERITRELAREICQRRGLKAFIVGTISNLGTSYALTLEAVNSVNGEKFAIAQFEAESKEKILKSLSKAATEMRKKLGESLATIEKFDKPLEATTNSLQALKAYSDAVDIIANGKENESLPYFKRAIELDPQFAMAYLRLSGNYSSLVNYELAEEALRKAFELRDHASERERVLIESTYYYSIQRDINKSIEILEIAKRNYPRDALIRAFRTHYYLRLGKLDAALKEHSELNRIMNEVKSADVEFQSESFSINLNFQIGIIKVMQGETGKAKEFFNKSGIRNSSTCLGWLFGIAFMEGNEKELNEISKLNENRDGVCNGFLLQAKAESFKGKWKSTELFYKKAVDFAQKKNNKEKATLSSVAYASAASEFGDCSKTEILENSPIDYYASVFPLTFSPLGLARCGKLPEAEKQINKLKEKYPNGTLENGIWIPMFKAQIELEKGNAKEAVRLMENAKEYEWAYGSRFYPQYILAQAYLKSGENEKAKAKFQKILDNRGRAPLDGLYPLAQLGKARTTKDKREYEKFFEWWKDADEDLEILIEAKKEYENLK
jgi:DNA-binding winged helix-turn-helix (wHTH) protein/lipopolysaccharide biosynthesis regulator YciM